MPHAARGQHRHCPPVRQPKPARPRPCAPHRTPGRCRKRQAAPSKSRPGGCGRVTSPGCRGGRHPRPIGLRPGPGHDSIPAPPGSAIGVPSVRAQWRRAAPRSAPAPRGCATEKAKRFGIGADRDGWIPDMDPGSGAAGTELHVSQADRPISATIAAPGGHHGRSPLPLHRAGPPLPSGTSAASHPNRSSRNILFLNNFRPGSPRHRRPRRRPGRFGRGRFAAICPENHHVGIPAATP